MKSYGEYKGEFSRGSNGELWGSMRGKLGGSYEELNGSSEELPMGVMKSSGKSFRGSKGVVKSTGESFRGGH